MAILMVDDNSVNLFVIEKILKGAGYENTVSLSSASQLFDYLEMGNPHPKKSDVDLILLDIMMPEIDGIEACRRIQEIERLKDIPIIFITALEDTNKLAEALDVGGMDYITKPINKVELLARIRVALRLKYEKDWHIEQEKKIRDELDLAMQVQRSLLNPPLQQENIQINVSHLPSFKLAGDMYYWHRFSEHRYGVILLDMMGHGISSSLVCMYISSVMRDAIKMIEDPELVIKELNRYMALLYNQKNFYNYYFTCIYLVIDTKSKTVEYVNAGHPPGFVLIDGAEQCLLERGSCAVGFFDQLEVEKSTIHFEKDIQLLLFTDGVIEANKDENLLLDKLQFIASQKWNQTITSPIHMVIPEEELVNQQDDMCILMIQAAASKVPSVI
ncbi:fused response regulator/phosphatase [Fictibacillus sp. WQ 8-8]|uniref:SpoIIE family protein phosphatase n=1 Tax=unclassified Fictibacillus TaxID=2644029 RepID=UPI00210BBC61|nr:MULTISPECIES: fused response regulator/phosphatase [unclassified Fictibacillus]MCQ6265272.1 fused response regulator/phosphatase [Fictibacillus sp. WQ 8-8]MED2971949.1 fused response regulator/phosphatase [Fictibacillus sp. B-59209]UZJ77630.1 fused response regulator/phosphatase [Fictibacillus sp. KU28468]